MILAARIKPTPGISASSGGNADASSCKLPTCAISCDATCREGRPGVPEPSNKPSNSSSVTEVVCSDHKRSAGRSSLATLDELVATLRDAFTARGATVWEVRPVVCTQRAIAAFVPACAGSVARLRHGLNGSPKVAQSQIVAAERSRTHQTKNARAGRPSLSGIVRQPDTRVRECPARGREATAWLVASRPQYRTAPCCLAALRHSANSPARLPRK